MISLLVVKLGRIRGTPEDVLSAMKYLVVMGARFEVDYTHATSAEMALVRETEIGARVGWAMLDGRRILVNKQFFRYDEGVDDEDAFLIELFSYYRETCFAGCIVADTDWGLYIEAIPLPAQRAAL